jgi:hypothetical protein
MFLKSRDRVSICRGDQVVAHGKSWWFLKVGAMLCGFEHYAVGECSVRAPNCPSQMSFTRVIERMKGGVEPVLVFRERGYDALLLRAACCR